MKPLLVLLMLFLSLATAADGQQSDVSPNKVCIVGNVMQQGEIRFHERLTVTQAINRAGGIRPDSKDNEVLVISWMTEPPGFRIIDVDLKAIKKKRYKDLLLQNLDIIEVLSRKPEKVHQPFVNPCPWVPELGSRM
ncbi:MAG TPA: hypothetical protein VIT88_12695 [Pyrinomonadaceae bacterium]